MHIATHAMAHILAHNTIASTLGNLLDSITDIAQMIAWASSLDTSPHTLLGNLEQTLLFRRDLTNRIRPSVIANPALHNSARINGQDIALLENDGIRGDAMNDLIVHRSANAARESTVPLESGDTAFHANNHLGNAVKLGGRYTRLHPRTHFAQNLSGQAARFSHFFNLMRGLLYDHALITFLTRLSESEYTESTLGKSKVILIGRQTGNLAIAKCAYPNILQGAFLLNRTISTRFREFRFPRKR